MKYVDELPKRSGNYGPRYPWREVADSGRVCELRQGEDFDQDLETARNALYQWAAANRYRARTRLDDAHGIMYVQLIGK